MYSFDDTEELGANAPRPIDVDSVDRGDFQQLSKGEGAVRARRNAPEKINTEDVPTLSKRTMIGLVVAALAIIGLCVALFLRALYVPIGPDEQVEETRVEASVGETITYRGVTYSLAESGGIYSMVEGRTDEDGNKVDLGKIAGTPLCMVLYDGSIVLPENLADGTWNVPVYTVGTGWSYLANQDGVAFGGIGTIREARLEGSTLSLEVNDQITEIPLEW